MSNNTGINKVYQKKWESKHTHKGRLKTAWGSDYTPNKKTSKVFSKSRYGEKGNVTDTQMMMMGDYHERGLYGSYWNASKHDRGERTWNVGERDYTPYKRTTKAKLYKQKMRRKKGK